MKTVSIPSTGNEYIVGKILCIGRNYVDHIKELGNETPGAPVVFMKPATAVVSDGESVVIPAYSSDCHYEAELAVHPLLCRLGPEPLDPAFTGAVLAERLAGRPTPIKMALLDQTVVAGLGNIYASEALFAAELDPTRPAFQVVGETATKLAAAIRDVLERAVAAGGSSLRDYVNADGGLGYFQYGFAVYGRQGRPCPGCSCDLAKTGGVRRMVQGGRATFFCQHRQR